MPSPNVQVTVPPELEGQRADVGLTRIFKRMRRATAQAILQAGVTGRDGRALRPGTRLLAGETLRWYRPPQPEPPLPERIPLLWQDPRGTALALDKPTGVAVHPTARHGACTITRWLDLHWAAAAHPPATADTAPSPGDDGRRGQPAPHGRQAGRPQPAHRLDLETSGVLLCYLPPHGAYYKGLFAARAVAKRYLAVVHGYLPAGQEQTIDAPLGLDPRSELGIRMAVLADGAPARTALKVLASGPRHSLVAAVPLTGRQHQIRVHLAHLGHPLVGDKLYLRDDELFKAIAHGALTAEEIVAQLGLARHALHAALLRFVPAGAQARPVTVSAPLPADLRDLIETTIGPTPALEELADLPAGT